MSPPREPLPLPPAAADPAPLGEGRFAGEGGLRRRAARGTIVNGGFLVGLHLLALLKGFIVAAFLTASEYGVWVILVISLGTLAWLREVGVSDKYIQQDEPDQELAFQRAFTVETLLNAAVLALLLVVVPLVSLIYGRAEILAPGLALGLAVPAATLQSPLWIFYRRMDFLKQRRLQAADPITSFVVTVALAIAGAGYWSLVVGTICGSWAAAGFAVRASPYRLAFAYDRATLGEYFSFSWPLLVATGSGVVIAQAPIFAGEASLGLAAVGAIGLASSISLYATKVDEILTQTLYPAICAVRDRSELLVETFSTANRLALLWGVPFGAGVALFAPDLIEFVIGERWRVALGLIQAFALIAAANQIGFNWSSYYMARGETRPLATAAVLMMLSVVGVAVPLLLLEGLRGFAVGMGVSTAVLLATRWYYLARLFPDLAMVRHTARSLLPALPAVLAVLAARSLESGPRSAAQALAELALYLGGAIGMTIVLERRLLREIVGYLRAGAEAPG